MSWTQMAEHASKARVLMRNKLCAMMAYVFTIGKLATGQKTAHKMKNPILSKVIICVNQSTHVIMEFLHVKVQLRVI